MLEGSCDCGAVRIELAEAPNEVTECNCAICRRWAALWSYFHPRVVRITGGTTLYKRGPRRLEFHFCSLCGCGTHWAPVDKSSMRMGVNMRLFPREVVARLEVSQCDAASWGGSTH